MTFAIILFLTRYFANVIARYIVWYLAYLAADWLTDGGLNNVNWPRGIISHFQHQLLEERESRLFEADAVKRL